MTFKCYFLNFDVALFWSLDKKLKSCNFIKLLFINKRCLTLPAILPSRTMPSLSPVIGCVDTVFPRDVIFIVKLELYKRR